MIRVATAFLAMACLSAGAARAQSEVQETAAQIRATRCAGCHGETGDSPTAGVPRLNGQSASYLYARLHSLRYPVREAPRAIHAMGDIAPRLESDVIAALANFYAGQLPPPWTAKTGQPGERLYRRGAKDIPACQSCHGARGEGGEDVPRLAGQHSEYLETQILSFTMAARVADPMNHHVWLMTPEQAKAVAAWLGN